MKEYPFIGVFGGLAVLFHSQGCGTVIFNYKDLHAGDKFAAGLVGDYKRASKHRLNGWWGTVESIEHAEFLTELAKNHGFICDGIPVGKFYVFSGGKLNFTNQKTPSMTDCESAKLSPAVAQGVKALERSPSVYTQEMVDNNTPPSVGMLCQTSLGVIELLLPLDSNGMTVALIDGAYCIVCSSELMPVDNRTDEQKLFDEMLDIFESAESEIACSVKGGIEALIKSFDIKPK